MVIEKIGARFEQNREKHISDLMELLRIPSVSAEKIHRPDCLACAALLLQRTDTLGFSGEIIDSAGLPFLLTSRPGAPGAPTILIYGHYDVQSVEPLDAWETPPFEPSLRNERIYARGAQDNKGQISYVLAAVSDAIEAGTPLPSITLLIEGGEEIGSQGLSDALPELKEKLSTELLLVCDTNASEDGRPAIVAGLRGIIHLTARLHGPGHDLHSGIHGGTAPNPLHGMAAILSSLHNSDGSIAVEHYLDTIITPSIEELEQASEGSPSDEYYKRETGTFPAGGDRSKSFAERHGFLPTIEINGISGGHAGDGMKTIIPAEAMAKISSRLVPGQDPEQCLELLIRHLQTHTPDGMRLEIAERGVGGPGFRLNINSPVYPLARKILNQIDPRGSTMRWEGASIPIVSALAEATKAPPLLIGFGAEGDRIHAPDESFGLAQFKRGYLFASLLLQELSASSK